MSVVSCSEITPLLIRKPLPMDSWSANIGKVVSRSSDWFWSVIQSAMFGSISYRESSMSVAVFTDGWKDDAAIQFFAPSFCIFFNKISSDGSFVCLEIWVTLLVISGSNPVGVFACFSRMSRIGFCFSFSSLIFFICGQSSHRCHSLSVFSVFCAFCCHFVDFSSVILYIVIIVDIFHEIFQFSAV